MKIGILALGRPTFDVEYAKENLNYSLKFLNSTNHHFFGSCELLLNEQFTSNDTSKVNLNTIEILY